MSTYDLDSEGFIVKGSYRVAPVLEGRGRTILEPVGRYYRLPTAYSLSYNDNMHQYASFTICVEMLDSRPDLREAILHHLEALGIYLEGYNEPKELAV